MGFFVVIVKYIRYLCNMKKSELTFGEGFTSTRAADAKSKGQTFKAFDWDAAAEIIKDRFANHPDLVAEAGLQGDWEYTGGIIFEDGKPTNDNYTYLGSNWAEPTLILSWEGNEQEELECLCEASERLNGATKWDETSLGILGIKLTENDN